MTTDVYKVWLDVWLFLLYSPESYWRLGTAIQINIPTFYYAPFTRYHQSNSCLLRFLLTERGVLWSALLPSYSKMPGAVMYTESRPVRENIRIQTCCVQSPSLSTQLFFKSYYDLISEEYATLVYIHTGQLHEEYNRSALHTLVKKYSLYIYVILRFWGKQSLENKVVMLAVS